MSSTEYINPNVDELFKVVNAEVTWMHTIWDLFIQLYGTSDENFEIMNATAPVFFEILKNILFDEIIMILNRLMDPPKTHNYVNASLERMIELIDQEFWTSLVASLQVNLENFRSDYASFRTWRNQRVSHTDLDIALKETRNSLPEITRGQVDKAIQDIDTMMNEFSLAIYDSEQKYVPFMVARGDANALLQSLRKGLDKKVE